MNRDNMLIEASDLLTELGDPNLRIYDATLLFYRKEGEPTAFEQYQRGHIPGAAFFDHQAFSDATSEYLYTVPPEAELARQIGAVGVDKRSNVIFYAGGLLPCSTRAWWLLRYAGHDKVRVLNGGLAAWEEVGGKVEQGVRRYEATPFECNLRPEMFAGKEEVLAALEDAQVCTVNTLTSESFEEAHITGSSLLPCSDLTYDMAGFLPDDKLATRLKDEAQHERVITYCGGGIAATVNAMAHLLVGNENVAVYDGSMNEWTGEGLPTTRRGGV